MTDAKPKRKKYDYLDDWHPASPQIGRGTSSPEFEMWGTVIALAVHDATRKKNRLFAVRWLKSKEFEILCGLLGFSMETVFRIRAVVSKPIANPAPGAPEPPLQRPMRPWLPLIPPAPALPAGPACAPAVAASEGAWTTSLDGLDLGPIPRNKRRLDNVSFGLVAQNPEIEAC